MQIVYKLVLVLIFSGSIIFLQNNLDQHKRPLHIKRDTPYSMKLEPHIFEYMTFGFESMISDLLVIKSILKMYRIDSEDHDSSFIVEENKTELYSELGITEEDINQTRKSGNESKMDAAKPKVKENSCAPYWAQHRHDHEGCSCCGSKSNTLLKKTGFVIESNLVQEHLLTPEQKTQIHQDIHYYLSINAAIDPQNFNSYKTAFLIFSIMYEQPQLAETILLKGVQSNPQNWIYYHLLSFNSILNNYKLNSTRTVIAQGLNSVHGVGLDRIKSLLTHFEKRTNPYLMKLRFLEKMKRELQKIVPEQTLILLIEKYKIYHCIFDLNKQIPKFFERTGKYPANIGQLLLTNELDEYTTELLKKTTSRIVYNSELKKFVERKTK